MSSTHPQEGKILALDGASVIIYMTHITAKLPHSVESFSSNPLSSELSLRGQVTIISNQKRLEVHDYLFTDDFNPPTPSITTQY